MIIAVAFGLAVGVALGFALNFTYPTAYSFYITMALLAALDSLLGAVRSQLEGKYNNLIFLTGFVANALLAGFLAYLGDRLGVPLYYAAILVFGGRLFNNLAAIRRITLDRLLIHRQAKQEVKKRGVRLVEEEYPEPPEIPGEKVVEEEEILTKNNENNLNK